MSTGGGCAYSPTPCRTFGICQSTPGIANSSLAQMNAGSHRAHVTDVKESGDAMENVLLPATSPSMNKLAVGQQWRKVAFLWGARLPFVCSPEVAWLPLGTEMRSSEPLWDHMLVQLALVFLLLQENVRPHLAGVCHQFQQDESIDAMDWPVPDLNPVEHIWNIMSSTNTSLHQTVQKLANALVQV